MKSDISLTSFPVCHLYIGRLLTCDLILYPATLLNMFISYRSFMVEFLGSLVYTFVSSADKVIFTSSFTIYIPCSPSVSCFDVLAMTLSTVLNRLERVGNLVLSLTLAELL